MGWADCISTPFSVSNGVMQGGKMSSILFNTFMENLCEDLCNVHVGCRHDSVCYAP